ncbi:MAG: protein-tyrosine phosphatase, partial [Actinomycetota bacterium]
MAPMSSRFVPLQEPVNFRDLGGLPIVGGGTTQWGRAFRSDTLQELGDVDVKTLRDDIGLSLIIDLRTTREIAAEGRGPLESEPIDWINLPFIADLEVTDEVPDAVERDVLADYVHMLDTAGAVIADAVYAVATSSGA